MIEFETLELCGPILQQGRVNFVETWLQQDKLFNSEELGDLVKTKDVNLATSVYKKCNAHQKLAQCYMETGQLELAMQIQS